MPARPSKKVLLVDFARPRRALLPHRISVEEPATEKANWSEGGNARVYPKETMRVAEAAELLGVAVRTLEDRRWRARHRIPFARVGRCVVYRRKDLERYLQSRREGLGRVLEIA